VSKVNNAGPRGHRGASPPSLAEQPRLSLQARRANQDFLTRPNAEQGLLVVVPEDDRVASVLAQPVCSGLLSLARGSLLQNCVLAAPASGGCPPIRRLGRRAAGLRPRW
jgi:hypothetical protein